MAIPKKVQEQIDALQREVAITRALRWTSPIPKRDVVSTGSDLVTGWTYNTHTQRVDVACSDGAFHAIGRTDKTTTQQSLAMYSTKALALRALRAALEREFAMRLEHIDRQIEAADNK